MVFGTFAEHTNRSTSAAGISIWSEFKMVGAVVNGVFCQTV